jgi:hypothetical protein
MKRLMMLCNSDEPSLSVSIYCPTTWETCHLGLYSVASCGDHGGRPCCKPSSYKIH